jgi:hypothetical protein
MPKSKKETKSEAAARRARELKARRAGRPGGKELNTGPNSEPRSVRSGTEDTEHDPQGYNEAMTLTADQRIKDYQRKEAEKKKKKGVVDESKKKKGYNEAMSAAEYRKKGIYVTDSKHHNCKKVHPDTSHKAWEKDNVKEENTNVLKFIGSISKKNYAAANKYLQLALEDKLRRRIASTANNTEF